jgi:hypothetical protein
MEYISIEDIGGKRNRRKMCEVGYIKLWVLAAGME